MIIHPYKYNTHKKITQRQAIRMYIRTIRHAVTPQEENVAAQLLTNKTININHIYQSKHIGIYFPFDGEINTNLLIKTLLVMKKHIYLPILPISNTQCLLFSEYTLSTPLKRNRFNIYEPLNTDSFVSIKSLDIIFIPLVAFDEYGNRLGMGGGFYDRTLQKYPKYQFSYIPIGLAYDFQKIPKQFLPIEQWDIKLSEIITPYHHWRW